MMKNILKTAVLLLTMIGCSSDQQNGNIDQFSYDLGGLGGFCELVAADVKRLALSTPLPPDQMDKFLIEAKPIADRHGVQLYRETDLLVTELFPEDIAKGLDVLLIFKGTAKDEYLALKKEKEALESDGKYSNDEKRQLSRRFGRLLSYSTKKVNQLLSENTEFRSLTDFGIKATNVFLYYKDLEAAGNFYQNTLGLELLADYQMALIFRITEDSYLILVDEAKGIHSADEPKTVALALLTEQLDEWHDYLKAQKIEIKYDYKPKKGGAHDGFVAYDPEGYLLEFERFKQHPENEKFIPLLNQNTTITDTSGNTNTVPEGLGFHSTITWLYHKDLLKMQTFFEENFGLEMVADQGWTKIYAASKTGFVALVDEKRGMHTFSENKAVNVSFIVNDVEAWFDYSKKNPIMELRSTELEIGPENKYKAFVGYGPEGYYYEFDQFFAHEDNNKLLHYLKQ